ncbi:uncharacterized protein LOC121869423 [Homarus americanus]|uniref:Uncharacterized protein n=1 Tax=Homarus americanus TaxID=6706 RepID=A0A8J5K477_HOMAM|nr:uncharacterized protein LOC121869423 [Homarus americanus]KAG7166303.1 hypothetical protein Hamer_G011133 [Homarus americanus]
MRLGCVLSVLVGVLAAGSALIPLPIPLPAVGPGPLIVAGLWSLKAIAILGYKKLQEDKQLREEEKEYENYESSYSRQKRAITQGEEEVEEAEKLLLSAATHLDTDGCVLKLLCHLNNKQVDALTLEETVLLQMFSDSPETMSSYNTTIQEDSEVDQGVCDKMFPNCPLTEEELGSLLRQTWGCGSLNH